ncbi:cardiolipin synthase [Virgibacillus halodenitrificans]|uniref:cardiolipin synthase n=1 Tax=Virgibacillus halodenitrificans TaxID=1482 RepID=UPI000EF449D4|nr:cardiolipin synthase [Virgibacillus halodenitrificans]MCG1028902.1 cardiolipin synthase [Virgibacillus halodenitrificans]MYL45647.1 cardiolipin synthase [Virgibacillus halodenitrificans]
MSILLSILFFVNIILAIVIIFFERQSPSTTWAWLMVLVFLPVVGFILYLIFNQNFTRKKMFYWADKEKIGIKERTEEQIKTIKDGTFSFKSENSAAYKDSIFMHLVNDGALFTQDNDVTIYTDGREKFDALLADIKEATDHIHIQYYIIHEDGLGKELVAALTEKAKQGVQVRVLYDYMGSRGISSHFYKELKQAGGLVEVFFPNFHLNYRNHRKLAIMDGKIGYVGGFNVGDEYLGLDKKFGYWRDTHLRTEGEVVHALQTRFILDWNQASKHHDIAYEKHLFPSLPEAGNVGAQIVSSGPDTEWQQIKNGYVKMVNSAKKYIYLQTPYFIPDESLLDALKIAAMSGVDVRVMIPDKPDHMFVYWATLSHAGELLKAGAKIYVYENGFIHAKTLVVDDTTASVGTANIDPRSFKLNFEVNAFLYDEKTAEQLRDAFEKDIPLAREITWEEYKKRPKIIQLKESVSRLISPVL